MESLLRVSRKGIASIHVVREGVKMLLRRQCVCLAILFGMALSSYAAVVTNSFVIVEGEGVGIDDDGSICLDDCSSSSVKVTARSGWLVNGRPSIVLSPSKLNSAGLKMSSKLGEDSHHIHYFPSKATDKHVDDIKLRAWAYEPSTIAMYAYPKSCANVSASARVRVDKMGRHEIWHEYSPCQCGAVQSSQRGSHYDVEPDRYEWTVTAKGSTDNSNEWSGTMQKGKGQKIVFRVTGKRDACSACTCRAEATTKVDVFELSIDLENEYLGLDMTDEGAGRYVLRDAVARVDPAPTSAYYNWATCGRCDFVGSTSREKVSYGALGSKGPSSSYRSETLRGEARIWNGMGLSTYASCTTNFTVVKVDVGLGTWGEKMDEKNNTVIGSYVKRNRSGIFSKYPTLAEDAMKQFPVSIEICPDDMPKDELVSINFEDNNLILDDKPKVSETSYTVEEIKGKKFYLFDESGNLGKKYVEVTHQASSAKDKIVYDVCCCTFTIYSDCSELFAGGASGVVDSLDQVGHSFWKIDVDEEHKHLIPSYLEKYVGEPYGFYPNGVIGGGKQQEFYDVDGRLDEDSDHLDNIDQHKAGTVSHVWHISFDGCLKGLERVYSIDHNKPRYDLACFNCTDAAVSVGRACGAPVPDAGLPDLWTGEIIRQVFKGWEIMPELSPEDGIYSCPLSLLVNLFAINGMYGETE